MDSLVEKIGELVSQMNNKSDALSIDTSEGAINIYQINNKWFIESKFKKSDYNTRITTQDIAENISCHYNLGAKFVDVVCIINDVLSVVKL